jgi:urease accessory protein
MPSGGLLGLLQLADSGFPSGAFTLSHGLETLVADGTVSSAHDVAILVEVSLLDRLARADLVILLAVHQAVDLEEVLGLDRLLSTVKLAEDDRTASRRVGTRLAIEASRLVDDELLLAYIAALADGRAPGNAAVAMGLATRAFGVASSDGALGAAWSFASGLTAAAVRLGLIGHGDAQRILREAGPTMRQAVERATAANPRELRPSAPQLDLALARHETAASHLFAS